MKLFRMFGRNIRDAFKSVGRNFSLSIASISCISITLIVVGLSLVLSFNVKNFSKIIKNDVTVVVFLNTDTTKEEFENTIKEKIISINNIDSIVLKSKEESKQEMMEEDEIFKATMATWPEGENPLRDSYLLKVKDIELINDTVSKIKEIDKVEVVDYGEGMVQQLIEAFKLIEKITIIIVAILVVVTVFLIINTIKLTIFSRKREISIMRLVGASNLTIKIPFVIEGMLIGALGSIVPIGVVMYGYTVFYDKFDGQVFSPLIKLISPEPFIFLVSAIILIIGILVGMLGSGRAVRKYLKV